MPRRISEHGPTCGDLSDFNECIGENSLFQIRQRQTSGLPTSLTAGIHSVHIGAVESVPARPVHGDTLCHGFIAMGEHLGVCVSTCWVHTGFNIGSAGHSESVDRVEKPVETDIGRLASAHHAELHIACLRAAFRPKPSHTHGMMHYKSWNLAWALLSGMLNALGAWALFVALKNGGKASIVAPLTALYPLVVIALVPLVLRESVTRLQFVGVASAQIAVVLLSI